MSALSDSYVIAATKGDWLVKLPLGAVSEIRGGSGQSGAKIFPLTGALAAHEFQSIRARMKS